MNDFEQAARMFAANGGNKLAGKDNEINAISSSKDAAAVKSMLDKNDNFAQAVEKGDTAALGSILENIMKTDEGSRLISQLSNLIK